MRVAGTTFNQIDATIRAGYLASVFPVELPHVPGIDVSGTVVAVGDGVAAELVGREIVAFLPMTAPGRLRGVRDRARSSSSHSRRRPFGCADASALASSGLTAWQAIVEHAAVQRRAARARERRRRRRRRFAVQLAASSRRDRDRHGRRREAAKSVAAHGTTQVIDYTTTPVADAVTEPVDVVLNLVRTSPDQTEALVSLVKPGGVFVSTTTPGVVWPDYDVRAVDLFVRSDSAQLTPAWRSSSMPATCEST